MYDVNYFINKFSAIPEELWCTGHYEQKGTYCAIGHCIANGALNGESGALTTLFALIRCHPIDVNDLGISNRTSNGSSMKIYHQSTPKERILAALRDIKAKLEPKPAYPDITKELAVLPVDETADCPVRELTNP